MRVVRSRQHQQSAQSPPNMLWISIAKSIITIGRLRPTSTACFSSGILELKCRHSISSSTGHLDYVAPGIIMADQHVFVASAQHSPDVSALSHATANTICIRPHYLSVVAAAMRVDVLTTAVWVVDFVVPESDGIRVVLEWSCPDVLPHILSALLWLKSQLFACCWALRANSSSQYI